MKRRMIIAIILSMLVVLFFLLIGGFYITLHPFSIGFTRIFNMLGWLCIMSSGIFFSVHYFRDEKMRFKKQLDDYITVSEQQHLDTIKNAYKSFDNILKEKDDYIHELEVKLSKRKHGN